ncbi:MAG: hypothetical protein KKC01_01160 [Gammaproteobacteria bacterium]|nr:hypothetical protein [Gammaproteobacteria bacterium]
MDKQALQQKRDELTQRLQAIRRDLQGGLDRDMSDQAIQLENRDTLLEIARVTEQELAEIERQLAAH